ncbi:hypothetical protein QIH93_08145 [Bradyrhizobium ottawaense]|uniref:hypothetical protein n=1 Tax=Bradyrhizobium ottawaense TaxID=931866 RepID=UPI002714DDC5|nr:hypothetical protein [Bradyrhizobium ottawaense]WLB47931.1 hypothetical protein QIH93_08145 [Bradyrhizobium ottawaense]
MISYIGLRTTLLIFGLLGIPWSAATLPIFISAAPARELAERIAAGERFKPGAIARLRVRVQSGLARTFSAPEIARAHGLASLLVAEEATQRQSSEEADRQMIEAETGVQLSLKLNPTDSFLWLMLYSVNLARNGIDEQCMSYLEQSYTTGRSEGWIALRRNRLALAVFQMLNERMQESVISEFAAMVDSDFIGVAAANLQSVGWSHRERLLAGLGQVDIMPREVFAKWLAQNGVKVTVPGVNSDERPWR